MAQSVQPALPTSALVTAYRSHANASEAPRTSQQGQNADPFGPAVITDTPHLSGATVSAIKEVAASTTAPTPELPGYDRTGQSTNGAGK